MSNDGPHGDWTTKPIDRRRSDDLACRIDCDWVLQRTPPHAEPEAHRRNVPRCAGSVARVGSFEGVELAALGPGWIGHGPDLTVRCQFRREPPARTE